MWEIISGNYQLTVIISCEPSVLLHVTCLCCFATSLNDAEGVSSTAGRKWRRLHKTDTWSLFHWE